MSTVFLFGAGASYGSGDVTPERPPLGNGPDGLFRRLQREGGVAASVDAGFSQRFEDNFELGMEEFARTRSGDLIEFTRDLGRYLCRFKPGKRNHYRDLASMAAARPGVVFASLNYDRILEEALSDEHRDVIYSSAPNSQNDACVLKIHGSCNFLPQVPPNFLRGIRLEGGIPGQTAMSIIKADVLAAGSERELDAFYGPTVYVPPALAMYAPGKFSVVMSDFVRRQQRQWADAVAAASQIFVIGVAVNPADGHIWSALARSSARVSYIGQPADDGPFEDWRSTGKHKTAAVLAHGFERGVEAIRRVMSE